MYIARRRGLQPNRVDSALTNGWLDNWTGGTSFVSTGSYTTAADNWVHAQSSGISQFTFSRQAGTSSTYAARLQRNETVTATPNYFVQSALTSANSTQYRGQYLVWAVDMKAGANLSAIVQLVFYSGTGTDETSPRNFTGAVSLGAVNFAVADIPTAAYGRFFVISNQPVPSNSNQLGVTITKTNSGTAGADDWVQIERASLRAFKRFPARLIGSSYCQNH